MAPTPTDRRTLAGVAVAAALVAVAVLWAASRPRFAAHEHGEGSAEFKLVETITGEITKLLSRDASADVTEYLSEACDAGRAQGLRAFFTDLAERKYQLVGLTGYGSEYLKAEYHWSSTEQRRGIGLLLWRRERGTVAPWGVMP